MNLVKFAVVFFITSCLSLPSSLYAAQCSAIFPDGIATHGDTVSNSKQPVYLPKLLVLILGKVVAALILTLQVGKQRPLAQQVLITTTK